MSSDVASRLREGTQISHTMAENTAFMKCFLKHIIAKEPFRKLLANLYFVYSTIEEELERYQNDPVVGSIYFPELNRKANLEEDLAYYYGENWREEIVASDAGKVYVERIREVADKDPALLIAHSYVRYMGDLSGGQGLRNIARTAMNLPPDQGTRLHEFDALKNVEAIRNFKGKYRDALNALPVDDEVVQRIIAEANYAFKLNRDVFHELEDDVRIAIGTALFTQITLPDKPGSTERTPAELAAR